MSPNTNKPGNNIGRYPLGKKIPIQRPNGPVEATVVEYDGEDNFNDVTGNPWMKIAFVEGDQLKSKEVTDAELDAMITNIKSTRERVSQGISTEYPIGRKIKLQREGGVVEGEIVENDGEDQFNDITGERYLKIRFVDTDGQSKTKLLTEGELGQLANYATSPGSAGTNLLRVMTKYPLGTQFQIDRGGGIFVAGHLVANDTDEKFDDDTGHPLFKILFTDTDGRTKRRLYAEGDLDQLSGAGNRIEHVQNARSEVLDGRSASNLKASMVPYITPEGHIIVAATDKGIDYADHNEDRMFVDVANGIVAAIDGMGGMGNGDKAAEILGEEMQRTPKDIPGAAQRTQQRIINELRGSGGACFTAIDLKQNLVFHSGDTKCIVFDRNGIVKYVTVDQTKVQRMVDGGIITEDDALHHPDRNVVSGGITAKNRQIEVNSIDAGLHTGDRVVLMSDGINDNLTTKEIWTSIQGRSPEDAMSNISDITDSRMANADRIISEGRYEGRYSDSYRSEPKKDNRAFAVVDIK